MLHCGILRRLSAYTCIHVLCLQVKGHVSLASHTLLHASKLPRPSKMRSLLSVPVVTPGWLWDALLHPACNHCWAQVLTANSQLQWDLFPGGLWENLGEPRYRAQESVGGKMAKSAPDEMALEQTAPFFLPLPGPPNWLLRYQLHRSIVSFQGHFLLKNGSFFF